MAWRSPANIGLSYPRSSPRGGTTSASYKILIIRVLYALFITSLIRRQISETLSSYNNTSSVQDLKSPPFRSRRQVPGSLSSIELYKGLRKRTTRSGTKAAFGKPRLVHVKRLCPRICVHLVSPSGQRIGTSKR